jgi:hypothetical protein
LSLYFAEKRTFYYANRTPLLLQMIFEIAGGKNGKTAKQTAVMA